MAKRKAQSAHDKSGPDFKPAKRAKQEPFLRAFAECGTVSHAAAAVNLGRRTIYTWLAKDPKFKERYDEVNTQITDNLEKALYDRATKGVENPVFHEGEKCGVRTDYSDTAAIFLLKARNPERFNEKMQIELAGKKDAPLRIEFVERPAGRGN